MEINEDQPNENKQKLFRACYKARSQPPSVAFNQDSKTDQKVRELYSDKREWFRLEAVGIGKPEVD